MSMRDDLGCRG